MEREPLERQEQRIARVIAEARPLRVELATPGGPTRAELLALLESQLESRAVDLAARRLRAAGQGYYTIASAGHEQNAVLGALLEVDDPCFLHYRSGALVMARARKAGHDAILRDVLLSLAAARDEPIAAGRHKVWGSRPLWIVPQTSTIASHVPKAVGFAFALSRCRRLGVASPVSEGAIVLCSFGDASTNHATALSGLNAARYAHRRGHAVPILFVCEDNGLGISERAPEGFVADTFSHWPGLDYVRAEGSIDAVWAAAAHAIERCRRRRGPVFLHLECVRLGGHAGSDAESAYRLPSEIGAMEERDPIALNLRHAIETGRVDAAALARLKGEIDERVAVLASEVAGAPTLADADEVLAALPPLDAGRPARGACRPRPVAKASVTAGAAAQATGERRTLAASLNAGLAEILARHPESLAFGEDVGRKGGVYGVTAGLQRRFGASRVFDTLLDETTILGTAQGLGLAGLLPIAEIQYLAYVHNAIDQLRGEACSLSFFSAGQFRNPMLVRMASFAYQKGFGGHFHNDNAIGALREIPGLAIAAPARGDDAIRMLRAAVALAKGEGRVVCMLEPIALYFESDLHAPGDQGWLCEAPGEEATPLWPGEPAVYGPQGADLLIVSYANGLRFSLRAARVLADRHGLRVRVLDLRWLSPLPIQALIAEAAQSDHVLVVDECRATGAGIADAVVAALAEAGTRARVASLRALDSYVPLGPAARFVLVGEDEIVRRAVALVDRDDRRQRPLT